MADGRSDTAWRPNPSDPAPWIEVATPASTRVREVRLTLEGSSALKELRVQVSRDGEQGGQAKAGTAAMHFATSSPDAGGSFRIAFRRSGGAAGRLVAVSALMLRGEAEAPLSPATPNVKVKGAANSLGEPFVSWWRGAPYPSLEAMCERYHQLRVALPNQRSGPDAPAPESSNCSVAETIEVKGTKPAIVAAVHVGEVDWGAENEVSGAFRPSLLFFRTQRGWSPADTMLSDGAGNTDLRASVAYVSLVSQAEWRDSRLVLHHLRRRIISGGYGDDAVSAATLAAVSCGDWPRPSCDHALVAYGDPAAEASQLRLFQAPKTLWAPPDGWLWQRDYEPSASGKLRLGSCRDGAEAEGKSVPCYATVLP